MKFIPVLFCFLLSLSCVSDPVSLMGCHFRIESTSEFHLAGIDLTGISELDSAQVAEVTAALDSGHCPVAFVVNVSAQNPHNTGDVIIEEFDWNGIVTVEGKYEYIGSGGLSSSVQVGENETILMPMSVSFDAADVLYGDISVEGIIEMCLAIGGSDGDIRDAEHLGRLSLETTLCEDTPMGLILIVEPVTIGITWVQPE